MDLFGRGQVGPADMVWHEGMPTWTLARNIAELLPPQPSDPAPLARPIAVGYYTSTLGFPARAVANLRGHATPRGDTGDWPLDDARILYFEETVKLRKKVASAASLYRSLLLLTVIGSAIILPISLFSFFSTRRSGPMVGIVMVPFTGIILGFCLLYYFANRATRKSQRWAPLTMFIIFTATCVMQFVTFALTMAGPGMNAAPAAGIGPIIGLLFSAGFAYVSWGAFVAIPKYLAQPAWCQELIVKAGL
jgi:hypothetical protein